MYPLTAFFDLDVTTIGLLALSAVFLIHIVPYLLDPHGIRTYPGPFLAKFSDLWLAVVSRRGHRSEIVHKMHQKYGQRVSNPQRS